MSIAAALTPLAGSPRVKPIRVALVAYRDDLNVGGSLRVLETLARSLDPTRVEAHIVFTYGRPGPVTAGATVPVHFLHSRGPRDLPGWLRARRTFAALAPDIVHFHVPAYWLHAALVGRPYVRLAHFHGPYAPHRMSAVSRLIMRRMGTVVDASVCITRGMREEILGLRWAVPDRTYTVYNGIDCDGFATLPPRHEVRAALGIPDGAMVAGVVCRLAWYKGCRDAIRVIARTRSPWHLLFCGDGPMRSHLIQVAAQEGVADRVHFAGMLEDMRQGYAAMDAFLFVSRLEPFGLVIAEAMASRIPVFGFAGDGEYRDPFYPLVTSDNAVLQDRVHPADHGSPEPQAIIDQVSDRLDDYVHNPDAYRPMVQRAHQWVRERFDARVQAEAMSEVYQLAL